MPTEAERDTWTWFHVTIATQESYGEHPESVYAEVRLTHVWLC
jgi:hypothetical protein